VVLTGAELTLFTVGFLPGDRLEDRLGLLTDPGRLRGPLAQVPARVNDFLAEAVGTVRARFGGRVSYASLPCEGVGLDRLRHRRHLRRLPVEGGRRPVRRRCPRLPRPGGGPGEAGRHHRVRLHHPPRRGRPGRPGRQHRGMGDDGRPLRLRGDHVRDEAEQAAYLLGLLDVFDAEGVDSAFVNTFARYDLPHRDDPGRDLDMASSGVVKVLEGRLGRGHPGMPWEPKAAFAALADRSRG
jgi:hypothetical protein